MLFQAKAKYKWFIIVLFLSVIVFGVHNVYADKSDLGGGEAYDTPVDLGGDAEGQRGDDWPEYDMFDEDSSSEPASKQQPALDVEEVGEPQSTNPIKQRWNEGKKFRDADEEYAPDKYEQDLVVRTKDGEDHYFSIELALTNREMQRGLMYRKSMPKMHGMLFVFHATKQRSFWMKNTLIPLDLLFIEQSGRISHIHHMAQPLDESGISSNGPTWAVLEINGGMAHTLGIKEGDKVLHTAFRNRHTE